MSEITKLYENAGIEPERQDCCKIADKYWANNTESGFEYLMQKECPYNQECTDECEYAYDKVIYPPFTAEKQLEITKFLLKKAVYYDVKDDKYWFYYEECESAGYKPFDEAIAHFINKLWKDLTLEEKQQIKEILK